MPSNTRPELPLLCLALLLAGCRSAPHSTPEPAADATAIGRDVRFLASDALDGRRTGTPGNDSAAAYLERRLQASGLQPLTSLLEQCRSDGERSECAHGYSQPFVARPATPHADVRLPTRNVVATVPGRDPALRGQYVVLGAHFDHLGSSSEGALDTGTAIRNGADDNASGTAALLALAQRLARRPMARSAIVAFFSGEEQGLLGSAYFVQNSPVPLDSMVAMVNFDMVGRLRNDRLIVYGVETARELRAILDSANGGPTRLRLAAVGDGFGPSDHSSFYAKGIPVLHFFTDLHEDYHRATDDPEKLDLQGIVRVVDYAEAVVRSIGNRRERLTPVRIAAPAPAPSARTGSQAYLGTIPDMAASEIVGLRLTGVRPGSPADLAGLREGDVVVELGGAAVKDLASYSEALYSHQPGDTVTIVFLRGTERKSVRVVLGRRGQ
ncbi:MAG TPA: M28 family peptidase [Gemmatimonadaceae bacterium]|nr:M28 family peptidase [Gemmatimonadaceae bacterium]